MKKITYWLLTILVASFIPSYGNDSLETQKKNYPTDKCVVSGEKLGEMGDPVKKTVKTTKGDRLILLCCKGCIKKIDQDTEAYVNKLDESSQEK